MAVSKPFSGIESSMVLTTLAVFVLCIVTTFKLESNREVPRDYKLLDARLQESQELIHQYMSAPVLPSLGDSWREAVAAFKANRLVLLPDDGSMLTGAVSTYDGPVESWGGSVQGDPRLVMAVTKQIQQKVPVYLLDYSVDEGELKLYLAVVGI